MIVFNSQYMTFDRQLEPYQRAADVGYAITEFLWFEGRPFYPATALAQAKVAQINLSAPYAHEENPDNFDLIFQMPKADGGHFYEIVMRSDSGTKYGGWAWGEAIECADEYVNGYRVLRAYTNNSDFIFEYSLQCCQYRSQSKSTLDKSTFQINYRAAV